MPEAVELEVHGEVLKVSRYPPGRSYSADRRRRGARHSRHPRQLQPTLPWQLVASAPLRRGRVALYRYTDLVAWAKERLALYPKRIAP